MFPPVFLQSLSHAWFFVTPWTAARQASLSFSVSWSLLKLMSIYMHHSIYVIYNAVWAYLVLLHFASFYFIDIAFFFSFFFLFFFFNKLEVCGNPASRISISGIFPTVFAHFRSRFGTSSVQFSRSVVPDSLRPHGPQHARPPCPSPSPGVCSNSCPSSRWCHPAIASSALGPSWSISYLFTAIIFVAVLWFMIINAALKAQRLWARFRIKYFLMKGWTFLKT